MGTLGTLARGTAALALIASTAWLSLELLLQVHFHPVAEGLQRACALGNW